MKTKTFIIQFLKSILYVYLTFSLIFSIIEVLGLIYEINNQDILNMVNIWIFNFNRADYIIFRAFLMVIDILPIILVLKCKNNFKYILLCLIMIIQMTSYYFIFTQMDH